MRDKTGLLQVVFNIFSEYDLNMCFEVGDLKKIIIFIIILAQNLKHVEGISSRTWGLGDSIFTWSEIRIKYLRKT